MTDHAEWAEAMQQARAVEDEELRAAAGLAEAQLAIEAYKAFTATEAAFGAKVKQWRRGRGWSQDELASRMTELGFDMHQTTVAKIESGNRPLRVAEAAALAHIFDANPLAVFYSAVPDGAGWSRESMQEQMLGYEESIENAKRTLRSAAETVAYWEQERAAIALQLRLAAEAQGRGDDDDT
ncbi:hypothetical protein GCM10009648_21710 [Tsukamurella spumae]